MNAETEMARDLQVAEQKRAALAPGASLRRRMRYVFEAAGGHRARRNAEQEQEQSAVVRLARAGCPFTMSFEIGPLLGVGLATAGRGHANIRSFPGPSSGKIVTSDTFAVAF